MRGRKPKEEVALKKGFARRVKEIREQRGLSQRQLAELLKTDVMQVSRYERGIGLPSLETSVELARILHVSMDELLFGEDAKGPDVPITDVRLLERFVKLQKVEKRDREAVIILIDGVLARRGVEALMASAG